MNRLCESRNTAMLPSAVGLTHLRVYDSPAPDGLAGGSPHLHFACTECYYVVAGHGLVQTLCARDGYRQFALESGSVVWFSPGVIHRLVNHGDLEILVVMQNSGLPEAGDFVLTMPEAILADEAAYFKSASLSAAGEVYAADASAAFRRRDAAVIGFAELRADFDARGTDALNDFYTLAARLVRPKLNHWRDVWRDGPAEASARTGVELAALGAGEVGHLLQGSAHAMAQPIERRLGMCGTLGVYLPEGMSVAREGLVES